MFQNFVDCENVQKLLFLNISRTFPNFLTFTLQFTKDYENLLMKITVMVPLQEKKNDKAAKLKIVDCIGKVSVTFC